MAALNIAFEAPDNAGGMSSSNGRPIDLVHLSRQTMGDKALELEVLQMFARQARESMKELAGTDGAARAAVAHRLKGSAQSVGAVAVGKAAAALEEEPGNAIALAGVAAAVVEAENFILKLCR
ncbi:Hpt domain-containing protein [Shinella sp. PSBB067]|uniref:Hpt domain-containing protein n=1 Tax=unclassified Shinella TaxID=2643062 RepID=UPI00092BBDE9|nr:MULTISPECIES: Hpt domain-containing protein [unclassified Shinella]MBN9055937.1 Hpt domain-containing protein [Hyphomicrobiales bacterium]OJU98351.1 MAG: Hpt domain-containing protein [Shinella sp. 65-6]QRI65222.1 Hpt domain-containing protein [Shinella sp. PSBB067]